MKQNTRWSALLIGMLVTVIIIFVAIYLLDKIIPFSRDIKGVENGNIAYYQANTALNEALLSMSGSDPSYETGSSAALYTNGSGMIYKVTATWSVLPKPGQGNSEYDENWSILAPGKPVQLVLKSNTIDWTTTSFVFRIPNLDGTTANEALTGGTTRPIVNWSLSASGDTLQASGSQIMADSITSNSASITLGAKPWLTLSGSSSNFGAFYASNCTPSPKVCTLKFSLINPLLLTDSVTIAPYLEFQAYFNIPVPLQTAVVESEGYAGGFRKNITRFIQQMTTNEALDFTVFQ